MMGITIGSVVVKTAGRDAGKEGIVVDIKDNKVMVEGATRKRFCSIRHVEPTGQSVELKKGSSSDEIKKALKKFSIEARSTKPKTASQRPKRTKKKKEQSIESKETKKAAKKPSTKETAEEKEPKKEKSPAKKEVKK